MELVVECWYWVLRKGCIEGYIWFLKCTTIGGNCMHWKLGFFFLVVSRDKTRSINEATSFVSCGLQTIPINESKLIHNSVVLNKGYRRRSNWVR